MDDPTDLSRADYVLAIKNTLREVKTDDVPSLAAGVAFKIFMSIFPSLLAAVAIFGIVMTATDISDMLGEARGVLPGEAIKLLQKPLLDLADEKASTAGLTAVAGIATGLFAATSAAISLMKALSRAYDVPETRKFVRQRLVALSMTLALIVALVGIVLLLIAGRQVQETLLPDVPAALDWLLVGARFALALVLLILLFAFVYWIGPNRDHPSWVWMSPGALFGVVGWLVVAGGFTLYTQTLGNDSYNRTYGAIAGVVVLLLWLQFSMLVMLVGAEFNAEVERLRALHLRVGEGAGFAAPAASALVHADAEAGGATITETQVAAHAIHLPAVEVEPTLEMPAPPITEAEPTVPLHTTSIEPTRYATSAAPQPGVPAASPLPVRTAGAVAASITALAVFLGFARRRSRR